MSPKFFRELGFLPWMLKQYNLVLENPQYLERFHNFFFKKLPVENIKIAERAVIENCIVANEDALPTTFWGCYLNKLRLYKLKLLWDPTFRESDFLNESKDKVVKITDILSKGNVDDLHGLTTTIGSYQIKYDMMYSDWGPNRNILKFQYDDFSMVNAVNVEIHKKFGLRFAEIDVVFVGKRPVLELDVVAHETSGNEALLKATKERVDPTVQIKIFARFRRNYANDVESNGPWLVSIFKILKLSVIQGIESCN